MKMTTKKIKDLKNKRKITLITAYDYIFASLFKDSVDAILIGDSLNMSFNGKDDTIDISMDEMIYHAKAVRKGAIDSFLILDMPFGTYSSPKIAIKNATKAYQSSGINAVKIEGGEEKADIVRHLTDNNIAVVGHIGLLPQKVRLLGGYYIVGKDEESKKQLLRDAKAIEKAGAFCIICEGVISSTAKYISENIDVPLIGIGSGSEIDGQILVYTDMLGLFEKFKPSFARKYVDLSSIVKGAINQYKDDVLSGNFPNEKESF